MDADVIKIGFQAVGFLMTIGVGLYSWAMSRDRATQKELKEQKTGVELLTTRLVSVEKDIEHLPDRDALHNQALAIAEMRGDLSTLTEASRSTSRTVRLLDEYLRKRGER